MAKLKRKGGKDIVNDTLTIFVNSIINKLMDGFEKKNPTLAIVAPILVYYFGDTVLKDLKMVNSQYITVNSLEKALRNLTKNSNFNFLKSNSKFIQGDDLDEIQALEDATLIQGSLEDPEGTTEIQGMASVGDDIVYETTED